MSIWNKRGFNIGVLIVIFALLVILGYFFVHTFIPTANNSTSFTNNDCNFFTPTEVFLQGTACSQEANGEFICPKDAKLDFVVKMTARKTINVYASPKIGQNCDAKAKCQLEMNVQESISACTVEAGQAVDCPVGYPIELKSGKYYIYPRARADKAECQRVSGNSMILLDNTVENPKFRIVLNVKS